jgi:LmbE family N-acetylglucosaminyl deacetylase
MPVVTNSVFRLILSPHPDDAVLALGPCILAWIRSGDTVQVMTIFDGPPVGPLTPAAVEDRIRYSVDPVELRQEEDRRAVQLLGASLISVGLEELVYRLRADGTPRLQGLDDLYGALDEDDEPVIAAVSHLLHERASAHAVVYVPMGTGGHSDHRVVRVAAERVLDDFVLYDDMPYALREGQAAPLLQWPSITEADIDLWLTAVAVYESQEVPLFELMPDWRDRFRSYARAAVNRLS